MTAQTLLESGLDPVETDFEACPTPGPFDLDEDGREGVFSLCKSAKLFAKARPLAGVLGVAEVLEPQFMALMERALSPPARKPTPTSLAKLAFGGAFGQFLRDRGEVLTKLTARFDWIRYQQGRGLP